MSTLAPYATLISIAERSQKVAIELPARENAQTHWNGVGFNLLGQRFVAPLVEVAELMRLPPSTRVPGVKNFVIGVANVRGRLMAILDLVLFFGRSSALPRNQRRILAMEEDEQYLGFLVDESLGMQHFPSDSYEEGAGELEDLFRPYVQGGYRVGGVFWPVMSLRVVAEDPEILKLAQQTA
ncbi:MAG: chemotaxis protein CheW [Pseudomonadales bacterium]|nr:chemotaxis protein CheW [Pseudomonadales bacterium]